MSNATTATWAIIFACLMVTNVLADETKKEPGNDQAIDYARASSGTRQFQWDTENGPGWIKVLVEKANLGIDGAEVIEIFFPPAHEGEPHFHEFEILYVIEGELGHIVDGETHVLTPGMVGMVRYPQEVVHKTLSEDGVRVLVIWPLGNEVKGLQGMTETVIE
jgi:quercetin dioxygenase-like cupin family protein